METLYDVAVIGGGPAGSTAANLLAAAGRSVVVLEREKFPRFHIGESLLPYSMPTLERLGLKDAMESRFLQKHGAELATACGERQVRFLFCEGFQLQHTHAYQVERAVFDEMLLNQAALKGADVRQETTVDRVEIGPDRVSLHFHNVAGPQTLQARYLIDASGRNTLLGSQLKLKQSYPGLNKFSVFAHYDGVTRNPGKEGTVTRMVRSEDRWFWMIPLGETRMSIGLVMDTGEFKKLRMAPEEALARAIAEQPVINDRMAHATRISPVYSTGDYSYRNTRFAGPRWLMAGDAAGFIDPVFSTGVFLALLSGEMAADALHEILDRPNRQPALFRAYEKRINRVMDLYLRLVNTWYQHESAEVLSQPTTRFQLVGALNSVLAGNLDSGFAIWWRMRIFYLVVFLQRFYPLCPRLSLRPFGPDQACPAQTPTQTPA